MFKGKKVTITRQTKKAKSSTTSKSFRRRLIFQEESSNDNGPLLTLQTICKANTEVFFSSLISFSSLVENNVHSLEELKNIYPKSIPLVCSIQISPRNQITYMKDQLLDGQTSILHPRQKNNTRGPYSSFSKSSIKEAGSASNYLSPCSRGYYIS